MCLSSTVGGTPIALAAVGLGAPPAVVTLVSNPSFSLSNSISFSDGAEPFLFGLEGPKPSFCDDSFEGIFGVNECDRLCAPLLEPWGVEKGLSSAASISAGDDTFIETGLLMVLSWGGEDESGEVVTMVGKG